jgi:hypothetical protein
MLSAPFVVLVLFPLAENEPVYAGERMAGEGEEEIYEIEDCLLVCPFVLP